jgi:predicted nucleic acid-binding protein
LIIYLDTSAAVPLFVPEPATDGIVAWLETCPATLVSSDWILPEFASALGIKVRRGELQQRHAKAAWEEFERFSVTGLRLIPISRATFSRAAQLVRQIRGALRAGDSLHLASAVEIGAVSLATVDAELEKSARAAGLAVTRF